MKKNRPERHSVPRFRCHDLGFALVAQKAGTENLGHLC